jgi:hypothetical protein
MRQIAPEIFQFTNPDDYGCKIFRYQISHQVLEIYLGNPNTAEEFFILLDGLIYFEGTTHWNGANFRLGTDAELISKMRSVGLDDQLPDETLTEIFYLLVVDGTFEGTKRQAIKFIANAAYLNSKSAFSDFSIYNRG